MPKVRCGFCKDYFDRDDPAVVRVGPQSFCTHEHRVAAAQKNGNRPKAPTVRKARPKNEPSSETKSLVRSLDGNRCRFCGTNQRLHVHHIIYRSQGGTHEVENLITLCQEHHDTVHSNKKLFQPMCQEIVARRSASGDKATLIFMLELYRSQVRKNGTST
jgi:5-methylcytosine-specific restriction endonuclease McrA